MPTLSLIAWLSELSAWTLFVWTGRILGICFVPSVLLQRSTRPVASLGWILALVFLPYLGILLWWVFGRSYLRRSSPRSVEGHRRLSERLRTSPGDGELPWHADEPPTPLDEALTVKADDAAIQHGLFEPTAGNAVTAYTPPADAFDAFAEAIEKAKDHIHFQYYVWKSDHTGRRFRDLLADKAREGVEVRILYDAVGSVRMSKRFTAHAADAGAKVVPFLPVRLWERRLRINFRNHRKFLIVDGRMGFTGGVNIADEYLEWCDAAFGFQGPLVHQMQQVFAEDWHFATGESFTGPRYYPYATAETSRSSGDMLPDTPVSDVSARMITGGPHDRFQTIHRLFFLSIVSARHRLWAVTPYFVPDTAILAALQTAALRGVDVRIILPAQTDVPLAQYAGRTWWDDLLAAGVRLFEYQPRILHAKLMVIDHRHTLVGSANMDIRSFQLNFEANTLIDDPEFNDTSAAMFQEMLQNSKEVKLDDFRHRPRRVRLKEGAARLFTPLL